jgi:hypothetical protein
MGAKWARRTADPRHLERLRTRRREASLMAWYREFAYGDDSDENATGYVEEDGSPWGHVLIMNPRTPSPQR